MYIFLNSNVFFMHLLIIAGLVFFCSLIIWIIDLFQKHEED